MNEAFQPHHRDAVTPPPESPEETLQTLIESKRAALEGLLGFTPELTPAKAIGTDEFNCICISTHTLDEHTQDRMREEDRRRYTLEQQDRLLKIEGLLEEKQVGKCLIAQFNVWVSPEQFEMLTS